MITNNRNNEEELRNVIVIGASAGGLPAINEVIKDLTEEMNVAVLVVINVSKKSNSQHIANSFQRNTALKCAVAENSLPIKKGHLYVAPPEHQLMLKDNRLLLTTGAHEKQAFH